jgi:TPR repeat protein
MMYQSGEGIAQDSAKAQKLFSIACQNKLEEGCKHLESFKKE